MARRPLLERGPHVEEERTDAASIIRIAVRLDGQAVGTAPHGAHGVAGVYTVSTAETQRCQGIGAVLTAAALQAGRERDYVWAGFRPAILVLRSLGAWD
ncbi:GNAT family N-acetyltransferase [Streptomyces sp. NPDC051636]|uniref:GNAT family N-acetyltransferase n=1 Tax=Streptomyces sp. NPDC051636 TaxID=3365663 RepID=UPI0037A524D6